MRSDCARRPVADTCTEVVRSTVLLPGRCSWFVIGSFCRVRPAARQFYPITSERSRPAMLENVMVDLSVVLGSTTLPIRQILKMSRGAMIPLDQGHDDPTLVYANNILVA